jgi:hypothetical protein
MDKVHKRSGSEHLADVGKDGSTVLKLNPEMVDWIGTVQDWV